MKQGVCLWKRQWRHVGCGDGTGVVVSIGEIDELGAETPLHASGSCAVGLLGPICVVHLSVESRLFERGIDGKGLGMRRSWRVVVVV